MPVTIGELTTEVIAEPEPRPAAAGAAVQTEPEQIASMRAHLAAIAQQTLRTRAEGFDD